MSQYNPYIAFSRQEWQRLRKGTPLTLDADALEQLKGQNTPVSLDEVATIYLPLSRLLSLYVEAMQALHQVTAAFLGNPTPKMPYVIGIAGSVAVGKSTVSRILQALLARWPSHPRVDLVSTDGFLYPNTVLEQCGWAQRKGFPETYDVASLVHFLMDLKAGKPELQVPIFSHHTKDILPNQWQLINQPDIVILEGLNVLQVGGAGTKPAKSVFVSDFFDFSIYVDAETSLIKEWYLDRFASLREQAKFDKTAYLYQFADLTDSQARQLAESVWINVNEANLLANVLPFRERARLILQKGAAHCVERVFLRKI